MENRLFYSPLTALFFFLLAVLLFVVVGFLFLGLFSTAFIRMGFSWSDALLVLLLSLAGSAINIPIKTLESTQPMVIEECTWVFGVCYKIPVIEDVSRETILAINFGGGVMPLVISILLLYRFPEALTYALAGITSVALVTNRVARPVRGLGIVTPALIPPLIAALTALVLVYIFNAPEEFVFLIAYVGGTMGTLIGADILNLNKIKDLGAPIASIGGAGTFDGVFLSGIIAVLLV